MTHNVTIQPSGHHFTIDDDESILTAALRQGFNLPYGCRNGACGSCKGMLLAGTAEHTGSPTALNDSDREKGKILFCVAHATSDVTIECREVGAAKDIQVRILPCRVHQLTKLAPDVIALSLKLPSAERMQFLPGQYLDILLKNGERRSFSIANPPHDDAFLQLHLRLVTGGHFTEHVFNHMKEKDILRIEGPLGSFFLREDNTKPILFIATGTGFAPIHAIIAHALHHHHDRAMHLYWGARNRPDLYLAQVPETWEHETPNFKYVPVLSRAQTSDAWTGRTGYVTEAIATDFPDLSGYQVYACGAPEMVSAARTLCLERGLPEDEFFADAFSFQHTA